VEGEVEGGRAHGTLVAEEDGGLAEHTTVEKVASVATWRSKVVCTRPRAVKLRLSRVQEKIGEEVTIACGASWPSTRRRRGKRDVGVAAAAADETSVAARHAAAARSARAGGKGARIRG
jgi:DNA-binding PucR family transcriptional regulator